MFGINANARERSNIIVKWITVANFSVGIAGRVRFFINTMNSFTLNFLVSFQSGVFEVLNNGIDRRKNYIIRIFTF